MPNGEMSNYDDESVHRMDDEDGYQEYNVEFRDVN